MGIHLTSGCGGWLIREPQEVSGRQAKEIRLLDWLAGR